MDDEEIRLEEEAKKNVAIAYGNAHRNRAITLGKRLKCWYYIIVGEVILLIASFFVYNCLFTKSINTIKESLCEAKYCYLEASQILTVYYIGKASFVSTFIIILIWTLKRVTRLQAMRMIHSDKAVMANTLQTLLGTELDKNSILRQATKNMFSSSFEVINTKKKNKSSEIIELKELLNTLLKEKED